MQSQVPAKNEVVYQQIQTLAKDPLNAYLIAVFFTGVIQFVYCLIVGTFPFNSFLAGFLSCVGSFVLGICLKINGHGAFKEFIFAHLVLHLAVLNFIG